MEVEWSFWLVGRYIVYQNAFTTFINAMARSTEGFKTNKLSLVLLLIAIPIASNWQDSHAHSKNNKQSATFMQPNEHFNDCTMMRILASSALSAKCFVSSYSGCFLHNFINTITHDCGRGKLFQKCVWTDYRG